MRTRARAARQRPLARRPALAGALRSTALTHHAPTCAALPLHAHQVVRCDTGEVLYSKLATGVHLADAAPKLAAFVAGLGAIAPPK